MGRLRWKYTLVFTVVAVSLLLVYQFFSGPSGLEKRSGSEELVAEYSYYGAILGAIAALLSLLKEFIGLLKKKD